ncbi:MAG: DUF3179 domain-containing protein [Anaerolineae bacterium]|nr:DUF3179 domain-containing protein [Anaerolineae bacterium]
MDQLLIVEKSQGREIIASILESGDTRFIAVFLELLRAKQIGLPGGGDFDDYVHGLESLSGQLLGGDWAAWVEWYGGTDLVPPPGFVGWKGELLSLIDTDFADFLKDEYASTIRVEEIMWGGVVVDGIPALDNSPMILANEADYLTLEEPVFGISINGDHRAYPLRILDWHEMANDIVGGVPVSLAYCTLCGAGVAFDGRAPNGETYTFGSSGFLFRSNKLMYDRQTRTLWNQLTGEPVLGPLVGTDVKLNLLPIVLTTWADWLLQHPDTLVLSENTGFSRPYEPGAAYGDYFAFADTMFPVWQRSDLLPAKSRIFALQIDGIPKAYPVETLDREILVNDTLGGVNLLLITARGQVTVNGNNLRVGSVSYNAGGEVRAYERGDHEFSLGPAVDTLLDERGLTWQVTEEGLNGPQDEFLPRIPGHLAYWFGWYAFFPKTLIYGIEN